MPNNHSKYCIPGGLRVSGTPVGLHRDHCRPGIHPPASFGGEALDFQAAEGEEGVDGAASVLRLDSGEHCLPVRCLQLEAGEGCRTLDHVDHIYPVRQGRIEPVPYLGSGARLGEADLEVLGFTRCPGGGGASVRDLRVRREPSGIGDGQPCPANSPFNSARDVPVAGETHPASLSVPDNHAGSDGKHTRRIRRGGGVGGVAALRVGHQPPPGPAPAPPPAPAATTVSGRSFAPVGPAWISVPMAGQTPQS
jgi:hypothetical protein